MKTRKIYFLMVLILAVFLAACVSTAEETAAIDPTVEEVEQVEELEEPTEAPTDEPAAEPTDEAVVEPEPEVTAEEAPGEVEKEKILVYMSGPEAMLNKLEEEFEAIHGDVLDISILSCGQLRSKVWAESQAGEIQADVFWGSNPLLYNKLDEAGYLAPLNITEPDMILEEFLVTDHNYALVNERYITILYNSKLIEEDDLPASYSDLLDPQYENMIAAADSNQSSTAFAIAVSLYELFDETPDFFQGLKDNNVILTKSNGLVANGVMEGQYALGLAPYDPLLRFQNKAEKEGFELTMGVIWPEEGAIAMQRPVAIPVRESRTAGQQATAMALVNFLLSKKAQMITYNAGFTSVRNDIPNEHVPEGALLYTVDWSLGNLNEDIVEELYTEIFH